MGNFKSYFLDHSTIKHLRFPFSFFLLPVFMFALSQAENIIWFDTLLAFFILHILVFPSSNGYNSYQDKDESSIGGLKNPPAVTRNLFYTTLVFDLLALVIGLFISPIFSALILIFIIMSRSYSFRGLRFKKYPVLAFLIVFIFQGGFIFLISSLAITGKPLADHFNLSGILCMIISSLFIGSIYPLTQIYQHESDKNDGVISLSYLLGYSGTFIFSGILFTIGTILMAYYFWSNTMIFAIGLFLPFIFVMGFRMTVWFNKVKQDIRQANFHNTMSMNLVSSASMNIYFLLLVLINVLKGF
ncbi:MAG: UbiA family prenyltransferase [Bacteroidetes bacterium]|nr:UbiA family prenyltransferase [Bacteroidota bacterium]